jgi:hypothetical protein
MTEGVEMKRTPFVQVPLSLGTMVCEGGTKLSDYELGTEGVHKYIVV